MSVVVFSRNFQRLQGGHLKVFHYFEHVRSSPSHEARIRFSPDSLWDASNPWWNLPETVIHPDDDARADVLFLAGMGWRSLDPQQRVAPQLPIINLIQYFPLPGRKGPLNQFLEHPAIRICVSPEIEDALRSSGSVAGPIFTIPIGVDLEQLPPPRARCERDLDCIVLAIKDRPLGRRIAERLRTAGYRVLLVDDPLPRAELLEAMARARVTVHLPASVEGAYLPALESMALGAAVVCPDCVGNRSFCRDGETCLVPERSERAMTEAALTLLSASDDELEPMLATAYEESTGRALSVERARFLAILDRVEELWAARERR
jgi:glycosyltransferase involved in cell wall biosynthesis